MASRLRDLVVVSVLMVAPSAIGAQTPPAPPAPPGAGVAPPPGTPMLPGKATGAEVKKPQLPPPPAATAVAATVNGQPVSELAVYRGFLNDPAAYNTDNRKELLSHLIDNLLVDQYLSQLKLPVEAKEIDDRFAQIVAEAEKSKHNLKEMLSRMHLSEDDLRKELLGSLRWEKFLTQQANDKALRELFEKNPTMFNGAQVQARHILLLDKGDETKARLLSIKKLIEDHVAAEIAKLPAATDPITREKERASLLVKTFAVLASQHSTCPSKEKGGELGFFPRIGAMVEPFARSAFALKPLEMSDPVQTEFGWHLILCVGVRPGRDVKFEGARPLVQEVYGDRLREAIIAAYKPRSKIVINDMGK